MTRIVEIEASQLLAAAAFYILVMLTVGSSLPQDCLAESEPLRGRRDGRLWSSKTMGEVLVVGGFAGILTSWNVFMLGAAAS